jgi:hypothetical protein
MSSPNNADALPNILRLQGLKNVNGRRRVMPPLLDEEENFDVSGTSAPPVEENLPQADLGGELTSQSYDVRANTVQSSEEPSFWSKIGNALADYINPEKRAEVSQQNEEMFARRQTSPQTPPIETAQVDRSEGIPPVTASEQMSQGNVLGPIGEFLKNPPIKKPQQESSPGVFQSIADYFNPQKREEMAKSNEQLIENAQLRSMYPGQNPEEVKQLKNEEMNQEISKAMENPWKFSVYGSSNEVANSPVLQAKFKEITGMNYEPMISAQVSEYESAMKGVEDALNGIQSSLGEREEAIKQRILNNQATDSDKLYIGLALLMPLIVGGLFGKEAAVGALGGAAKGIADIYSGRQKEIRADEESLLDIAKQKAVNEEKLGSMQLDKAKLGPAIRQSLPEDPNQHLLGMRELPFVNPSTGKEERGIEILPGLVARSEFASNKDRLNNMQKAANELSSTKSYVDELNDLTNDVISISSQLKDKGALSKMFTTILTDKTKLPGVLSKLTEDVIYDGRKVNAGTLLEEKLGFLANAYGMAKELGQLDRAAQAHIQKIMNNPTSSLQTPQDTINQMLEIRKLAQRGIIKDAANKGFYPEFLQQEFEEKNNDLFNRLNQKESDKRVNDIKKKMYQSEISYGK